MSEFQRGLQAFERLIKSDDGVRAGSCRKCGGGGHLTFECRNLIKLDEPAAKPKSSSRFGFLKKQLGATGSGSSSPGSASPSSGTGISAGARSSSAKSGDRDKDSKSSKKSESRSTRKKKRYNDSSSGSSSDSSQSDSESDSEDDKRRRKSKKHSRSSRDRSNQARGVAAVNARALPGGMTRDHDPLNADPDQEIVSIVMRNGLVETKDLVPALAPGHPRNVPTPDHL
ncbi:hypothetical protein BGZ74_004481 [Mortierella antarctica]|nr:hypothetical protein BGZ74_004481 [Mortierella antarctica]